MVSLTKSFSPAPERHAASTNFVGTVGRVIANVLMATWRNLSNRRRIRELYHLDDHILKDMGLTRTDITTALRSSIDVDPSISLQEISVQRRETAWRCVREQFESSK
ncbi:MAG: DUF1127 domain-containing protein [Stappiaceae bacterium]